MYDMYIELFYIWTLYRRTWISGTNLIELQWRLDMQCLKLSSYCEEIVFSSVLNPLKTEFLLNII
jgi:hypothetical protein